MTLHLNESVKVLALYDPQTGKTIPHKLKWHGTVYNLNKINYYHRTRQGRVVTHVYHVSDGHMDFRLSLDSETLSWKLVEIYDRSWN